MSKRNKIIKETTESKALKRLRENYGLSLRRLADSMNISFTRVHQMESGRENVNESYIEIFLSAIGSNHSEWNFEISKDDKFYELRLQCYEAINNLENNKLELVHSIIKSL